jgi:ferrous iron transport protein A
MQDGIVAGSSASVNAEHRVPLGLARRGFRGRIDAIAAADAPSGVPAVELERRLLELGFVEGANVEVLHEGLVGRDPIAVRVNDATIALRRREAMAILVM